MYALLVCSMVSLSFILERCYFWWQELRGRQDKEIDSILSSLAKGEKPEPVDLVKDSALRTIQVGLGHLGPDLTDHLQMAAKSELRKMRSYQTVLDTVIVVAPLLGILGTVTGIINSFDLLSHSGLSDPQVVTAGIAEALITTATGLVIAISTVLPSQFFSSRYQRAKERLEHKLTDFEVLARKAIK